MNLISEKNLIHTIHEIVKRDGFVIIPEWGAFFLQPTAARWDAQKQIFYAPGYQLLFNARIKNNDGVLAIQLSKKFKCSYLDALQEISTYIVRWNAQLYQWGNVKLDQLGLFVLQKDVIRFESIWQANVFPEYFGLQNLTLNDYSNDRGVFFSYPTLTASKHFSTVVKTLVLVPLALTLALLPSKINNYRLNQSQSASIVQKIKLHQFIDNPQDISNSIDTLTNFKVALQMNSKEQIKNEESVKKEEKTTVGNEENKSINQKEIISSPQHKYFVIVGSFANEKQVNDFLASLKAINVDGLVLNSDGKRRVALGSYENRTDAQHALDEFKTKNPSYSGWVLNW